MSKFKGKAAAKAYRKRAIIVTLLLFSVLLAMVVLLYIAVNYYDKITKTMIYTTAVFGIVILAYLMHFLRNQYRTILELIEKIYSGMDEMGISNDNESESPFLEVNGAFKKLRDLIELIENLNMNIPFKEELNMIFDTFNDYIPYTHIGLALIEDDNETITAAYAAEGGNKELIQNMMGYRTYLKNTSLKKVVDSGKVRVINDLEAYLKGKPVKQYNKYLLEAGIKSSITYPLKNDKKTIGIIFFSSNKVNAYNEEHIKFLEMLAKNIMRSIEKEIILKDMVLSSAVALATLTEERDPETGMHLERMQKYSKALAELLSKTERYKNTIDTDYINEIEAFSQLHDIGKVAIRDEILLKPGKLTKEEFDIMKTHTVYGGKVLRLAEENVKKRGRSVFEMGIEIVEGHHEKWNGSGYPYGAKQEEIPLSARIVAIADVLDALTSKRPYKEPFSFEDSVSIINEDSGEHFDPFLIEIFNTNIEIFRGIYKGL